MQIKKVSFNKKKIKLIIILLINKFLEFDNFKINIPIKSIKWIVIYALKPPSSSIINLEKKIKDWNIVVVGNNETNDYKWNRFKSSKKLFYLSMNKQYYLNFSIIKFLKRISYFRKSIGYLYAIQNGAKEIYEIDEELEFNDLNFLNHNYMKNYVSYVSRKDYLMINPYPYFGYSNIWPRGFKLNDIGRQLQNKFYLINSSNIFLRPLIFQGLINLLPDIDSIFSLTRKKFESIYNFNKSESYPLLYFPNNYIPINSKNTRYLYEIFPLLIFPISLDESIADIWRGYLMQYFAWRIEGVVIYNNTNIFRKKLIKDNFQFNKEKLNFYKLNNILNFLVSHNNENKNSLEIFYDLLDNLIDNGVLKIVDKKIYNAFIRDLINIGYDFSFFSYTKINRLNHFEYLKIKTQFELYIPSSLFIMKNINIKLMNHFFSNKVYKDILLIINYNIDGFLKLNI